MNGVSCMTLQKRVITGGSEKSVRLTWMNITVQMYPCSEGTDTGSPAL